MMVRWMTVDSVVLAGGGEMWSVESELRLAEMRCTLFLFFFFNDTATTEIYTLSLHDALPISLLTNLLSQPKKITNWTDSEAV